MNEHNEFINEFYPDNQVIKEWSFQEKRRKRLIIAS